ncbi:MAG TPA: CTP synthase [Candidatus Saccharimonadales bacterium]|nr:CTP synthase [Candidatus Saccharimonadales bacterium]
MAARAKANTKYVFVTGGVLSGVGKGITAASIGTILKARGLSVNIQKCDPYLNVDAGLLNPAEHGECFVTHDGAETDLDVGHYERFLDVDLNQSSSLMTGRVLQEVIRDERAGKYRGKTVQIIPHVTNHIQNTIEQTGKGFDVHIIEIGGTVGDIESLNFLEAIREMGLRLGAQNCVFVHVVYVPFLGTSQEFKTKPAQNSVHALRGLGIVPDILIARSETKPSKSVPQKLSIFTGVPANSIALMPNAETIYQVPLTLEESGIGKAIASQLGLPPRQPDLAGWERLIKSATKKYRKICRIGIIAKYVDNQDTYMCVFEALRAAGWASEVNLELVWVNAEELEKSDDPAATLASLDGLVVPGGFGERGLEGKIKAAIYSLDNKTPYLGLCLGLQMAVIAAARRSGLKDATTVELNPVAQHKVIDYMADQADVKNTGGTMRLGDYPTVLSQGSKARKAYGQENIVERHRHRCECNNDYRDQYQSWGIQASGLSPDGRLVEIIEAIDHPYFLATQAHPEFRSRPNRPHPLFTGFIKACLAK